MVSVKIFWIASVLLSSGIAVAISELEKEGNYRYDLTYCKLSRKKIIAHPSFNSSCLIKVFKSSIHPFIDCIKSYHKENPEKGYIYFRYCYSSQPKRFFFTYTIREGNWNRKPTLHKNLKTDSTCLRKNTEKFTVILEHKLFCESSGVQCVKKAFNKASLNCSDNPFTSKQPASSKTRGYVSKAMTTFSSNNLTPTMITDKSNNRLTERTRLWLLGSSSLITGTSLIIRGLTQTNAAVETSKLHQTTDAIKPKITTKSTTTAVKSSEVPQTTNDVGLKITTRSSTIGEIIKTSISITATATTKTLGDSSESMASSLKSDIAEISTATRAPIKVSKTAKSFSARPKQLITGSDKGASISDDTISTTKPTANSDAKYSWSMTGFPATSSKAETTTTTLISSSRTHGHESLLHTLSTSEIGAKKSSGIPRSTAAAMEFTIRASSDDSTKSKTSSAKSSRPETSSKALVSILIRKSTDRQSLPLKPNFPTHLSTQSSSLSANSLSSAEKSSTSTSRDTKSHDFSSSVFRMETKPGTGFTNIDSSKIIGYTDHTAAKPEMTSDGTQKISTPKNTTPQTSDRPQTVASRQMSEASEKPLNTNSTSAREISLTITKTLSSFKITSLEPTSIEVLETKDFQKMTKIISATLDTTTQRVGNMSQEITLSEESIGMVILIIVGSVILFVATIVYRRKYLARVFSRKNKWSPDSERTQTIADSPSLSVSQIHKSITISANSQTKSDNAIPEVNKV